jgi:cobalt-precorrin-5B (C1)-methyltransferase
MVMQSFITKDGKRMRRGYTTGSCAAAAAKSAALMLLEDRIIETVHLTTPGGAELDLAVTEISREENAVSCGIVKDSGDDPDVTNGITVYARVEKTDVPHEISIDGGEGIGRVTKPGLDQPVGNAAINSVPRRMITEELRNVCEDHGYTGGLSVVISAPAGTEIAKRTFNPRLGIVGGISVLGTTGIVEPMSDDAVVETIRAELSMRAAEGKKTVLFVIGNYGSDFIRDDLHIDPEIAVTTSNFIGDAFALAAEAGFTDALLIGHIGKTVKLAGGLFNTHSRWGDCRAEIFASHAGACGASQETVSRLMDSAMTDDMLSILDESGMREQVMKSIMEKTEYLLSHRPLGNMNTAVISFSKEYGVLGMTSQAENIIEAIRKEY